MKLLSISLKHKNSDKINSVLPDFRIHNDRSIRVAMIRLEIIRCLKLN